jgi:calcineurin-like phosphoesterase family protein
LKVYATSDQHFTHYNIIKYAQRPFELSTKGVNDCIETIVKNYNQVVTDEDLVIFAGDLAHGRNYDEQILRDIINSMKGKKILTTFERLSTHLHTQAEIGNTQFEMMQLMLTTSSGMARLDTCS